MKNRKNRIGKLKRKLLTYVHEKTGDMLTMHRIERKAKRHKANAERKREKLLRRVERLNTLLNPVTE